MTKTTIGLQELKKRIHTQAKAAPQHRFWGLYGHICKLETLAAGYRAAKRNDGSPGIDRESFEDVERYGVDRLLAELRQELLEGRYRPQPNRRVEIPKGDGRTRTLGIPTVRDRIVQGAMKEILEPIFEADFKDCSYGYRPGRDAHQALDRIRHSSPQRVAVATWHGVISGYWTWT